MKMEPTIISLILTSGGSFKGEGYTDSAVTGPDKRVFSKALNDDTSAPVYNGQERWHATYVHTWPWLRLPLPADSRPGSTLAHFGALAGKVSGTAPLSSHVWALSALGRQHLQAFADPRKGRATRSSHELMPKVEAVDGS